MPPFREMPALKRQVSDPDASGGSFTPLETPPYNEQRPEKFPGEAEARKILDTYFGNYTAIIENLKDRHILPEGIGWVQKDLDMKMPEASFLKTSDYEMLFVLRLFHPETYEHSVRTYTTGREQIDSPPEPIGAYLRTKIVKELSGEDINHLSEEEQKSRPELEVIYRALLLHDMGKIAVPTFILDNKFRDMDWELAGEKYCSNHGIGQDICYKQKLEENPSLRPKDVVPVGLGLNEDQRVLIDRFGKNLPKGYERYQYDSNSPLGAIFTIHADISGDILEAAGHAQAAAIVREHHRAEIPPDGNMYPISDATLSMAKYVATFVHAADFLDAMRHARSYKGARYIFDVEQQFIGEVELKKLPQELVDRWIRSDIEKFEIEMQNAFDQSILSKEQRSEIGGPFNYYLSLIQKQEDRDAEREKMQFLLDKYRPRQHFTPVSTERRRNISQ